jgi:phosphohistidine phosphatase
MGGLMAERGMIPEVIISSPANRAGQTARLVIEASRWSGDLEYDERIYEASPLRLCEVVRGIEDRFQSAMLVGHNPGLEGLVQYLSGEFERMPTAALAVLDLNIDEWANIDAGCGSLAAVIRPKEVEK